MTPEDPLIKTTTNESIKKVYLFSFPSCPHVYSTSPFAVKVESFLRLHNIPYQTVHTTVFSSKGQIPYIKLGNEIDGEEVPDSNVILDRLKREFLSSNKDEGLSREEHAMDHAVTRMLEEHTSQIGFYYRYALHIDQLVKVLDFGRRMFRADQSFMGYVVSKVWPRIQSGVTKKKTKYRGLSHHSDEELWKFSNDDLRCIADFLGEKKFFHGDVATTIDCVVFGHLSQFLFIPMDFPQKKYLEEECRNVVEFMERFKSLYWNDWNELCDREVENAKYVTKSSSNKKLFGLGKVAILSAVISGVAIALSRRY